MRDWTRIDGYMTSLLERDLYPQPSGEDEHPVFAKEVIDRWMSRLPDCKTVLDVGCGDGFSQPLFEYWGVEYEGVCLGEDFLTAKENGRNVKRMDFSFLEYDENSFDLIFSRHSLEHSPMPTLTLMEWYRVSKQWLGLVLPAPEWYTYEGKQHYSVMNQEQIKPVLERAGWRILWNEIGIRNRIFEHDGKEVARPAIHEYWLFCEKKR